MEKSKRPKILQRDTHIEWIHVTYFKFGLTKNLLCNTKSDLAKI